MLLYGASHSPDVTRHFLSVRKLGAVWLSATRTSWRASWQSPSVQWFQLFLLVYVGCAWLRTGNYRNALDMVVQCLPRALPMAAGNSIIGIRRSCMLFGQEMTLGLWAISAGIVGWVVAIVAMLAYTFIPPFRKSRLVRFLTERDQSGNV